MQKLKLSESREITWYMFGRDPDRSEHVIDTNEYLLVGKDGAMLLDPGGTEIFPQVVSAISEEVDISNITHFLASHQDPDIMSSLPLWLGLCPKAQVYMSWVWAGFIAHFGHEYVSQFVKVPDEGMMVHLSNARLQLVPAHYCHSSGNFSLYDPTNGVLFSGDMGAALMPDDETDMIVTDFDKHTRYMEGFHRRWLPSNRAKNEWIRRVRALNPAFICPQHGAVFQGDDVARFLGWLEKLQVGSAI